LSARALWAMGLRPDDVVLNALPFGAGLAGRSVQDAAGRVGCFAIPIDGPADRQLAAALRFGASTLLAPQDEASALLSALRDRDRPSPSGLKRVGLFGNLSATRIDEAGRALGVTTYDCYGLAELGPSCASACSARAGLHWAEDHYLIE